MWIMLFIFTPLGIFLLWKYVDKYSKTAKIVITAIFTFLYLLPFFTNPNYYTNTPSTTSNTNNVQTTKTNTLSVPREYRNALKSAEVYSNQMHMSKKAIYDQLTSSFGGQFPPEAAQYAIDNIKADWNYNALKSAEVYSDQMNMSKNAIYEQLCSPYGGQFTHEEAQYAVNNL